MTTPDTPGPEGPEGSAEPPVDPWAVPQTPPPPPVLGSPPPPAYGSPPPPYGAPPAPYGAPPPPYGAPPGYQQAYPSGGWAPVKPPTYLVWAILVTVLCCLPGGIAGLVFGRQVTKKWAIGDVEGSMKASKNARLCVIIGGVGGFIVTAILVSTGALNGGSGT